MSDGRKTYTDGTYLYNWDGQHGEIEMYNMRERPVGILYPDGTEKKKKIKKRRRLHG